MQQMTAMVGHITDYELNGTMDGFEVAVRRAGSWYRWVGVVFLGFWLCGWVAGEVFAVSMLYKVVTGREMLIEDTDRSAAAPATVPAVEAGAPDEPAPSSTGDSAPVKLIFVGFMSLWLTLWTIGGLAAMRQMYTFATGNERYRFRDGTLRSRGAMVPVKLKIRDDEAVTVALVGSPGGWSVRIAGDAGAMGIGPFESRIRAESLQTALLTRKTRWKRGAEA